MHGKGPRERSVFLSVQAERSLRAYLQVRPCATSDFVFLFYQLDGMSTTAIHKRLMRFREQAEVQLTAHRLRHNTATQLLNAGCPVTSIQKFLGHKKLNTTMIYARAHDQTVAEDYFSAMSRVEQRLEIAPVAEPDPKTDDEVVKVLEEKQILTWIDLLALPELCQEERLEIAASLKYALFQNLARQHAPPMAYA